MKKQLFKILAVALLLIATIATCKKETPDANDIKLDKNDLELLAGETATLKAILIPSDANKTVSWESSDPTIATVDKGTITGIAFGTTTITVTSHNGHTAKCAVLVMQVFEPDMIRVDGGKFTMGCTDGDCFSYEDDNREIPSHEVTVSSFSIAKYPVTQKQWRALMGSNPSNCVGEEHPVERVSWQDAQAFIQKLNTLTGKQYRLPTEAEWEYAARGGSQSKGYKYSGSNDVNTVAWYDLNSGNKSHPVGLKEPNELKIYDMSGNVWEWCSDWYGKYSDLPQTNPPGPSSGIAHVIRGGTYVIQSQCVRVSMRSGATTNLTNPYIGFRLALP